MEVTSIQNGIIIDHVPAGTALKVLEYLKIDPSKTKLALIMNTDSHLYGTKDIIKIEDETESIDLDVLGLVARTATVGIVRGGKIVEKKHPTLPEHVVNIIKCVNPLSPPCRRSTWCIPTVRNTVATTAMRKRSSDPWPSPFTTSPSGTRASTSTLLWTLLPKP